MNLYSYHCERGHRVPARFSDEQKRVRSEGGSLIEIEKFNEDILSCCGTT
jgi:hypothetical protein